MVTSVRMESCRGRVGVGWGCYFRLGGGLSGNATLGRFLNEEGSEWGRYLWEELSRQRAQYIQEP